MNVQFMVKDSRKSASTGGWKFAQFDDGQPLPEAKLHSCYRLPSLAKEGDLVFTHYAP